MDVLNRDRSPVCGHQVAPTSATNQANTTSTTTTNNNNSTTSSTTTRNNQLLESSIQRNLTNFSLITHGFGTPAIMTALNVVRAYLSESMKIIDRQQPSIVGLTSTHSANHHHNHHHHHQQHQQQSQHHHHHHHSSHHHNQNTTHLQHANHLSHQQLFTNGPLSDNTSTNTTSNLHNHLHNQTYHHSASLVEPKKEII